VAGFELKLSPIGFAWERIVRGSASPEEEAKPPEIHSQAMPGNEIDLGTRVKSCSLPLARGGLGRSYSETPTKDFSCS
jgi:hypothetical protein